MGNRKSRNWDRSPETDADRRFVPHGYVAGQ